MNESRMNYKKIAIPLIIIVVAGIILGFMFFNSGSLNISHGSEGEGYFTFQIIDTDKREYIDGQIAITNFETGELIGIYDTNEIIYTDISIIATIYSVDLDALDNREVLPFTFAPLVEGTEEDPQVNTFGAYFYYPKENVSVSMVGLNGVTGKFYAGNIDPDTINEIELDITVDIGNANYSVYGASSYVPEHMRPPESIEQGINGFGLWFILYGTEVLVESVTVNTYETDTYYISDEDYSIILLDPVWFGGFYQNETVTLECKQQPTSLGIFQGFIDDLSETFVPIT